MISRCSRFLIPLLLLLAACSEAPKEIVKKKKEPEKPPEPVSGRYAFHQMYMYARTNWALDTQGLQLASLPIAEVKPEGGKYGAWQGMFASPSKGRSRIFTYSVVEAGGNLHKGVFGGPEEGFRGQRGQARPFLIAALKIDSVEAYQTAIKKGAAYVKKNPDMPVSFLLELTPRFPDPTWRVIWGESASHSNYSIFVDATTGDYLATVR
ncbi:MAG: hypothetical protein HY235_04325 [Acidobacteria bacterium]|nr:hypothetical protein [Acidobacteriota bacterium]